MELRHCRLTDPDAERLVAGLGEEYRTRYEGSDEMARGEARAFEPPDGAFVVLVDDGVTIAGGGFRRLSMDACEVKRMWTDPDRRRRGHARTILRALEGHARVLGYSFLRLETGPQQPEAAALYGRLYRRIETYGPYPLDVAFECDLNAGNVAPPSA
jgi:GNAT superfamily N-acetyltransferase